MAENLKVGSDSTFTWAQATAEGFCPAGWRLPSKADFDIIVEYVGLLDIWKGRGVWWSGEEKQRIYANIFYLVERNQNINCNVGVSMKIDTELVRCIKSH